MAGRARFIPSYFTVLALTSFLAFSCSESTDTDGFRPAPALIAFTLNGSTMMRFSGNAVWPPAGSGVIAGMDSSRKTLQIAGYSQLSVKGTGNEGPEPRFNIIFLGVIDTAGIRARTYSVPAVVLGLDITLDEADSMAYFGSSGSLTLTTVSSTRVEGTFFGTGIRPSDFDLVTVSGGAIDAPFRTGLFVVEDSGSTGGNIAISVGSGTTPIYGWTGGPANAVGVSRASSPASLVWGVLTSGGDSIASGVTHGLVPAGALRVTDVEPVLTAGVAYRVSVSRTDGRYGYTEFMP